MNMTTLTNALRNAVADDAATATWCQATYGQNHYIYVGMDERNPPADDKYPLVHLFPLRKTAGYDLTQQDHGIGATCGIHDSTFITTGRDNLVEYNGVDRIEAFRKLVETAIAGALPTGVSLAEMAVEYETIEFFPYFLASMELRLTQDLYQGDDPLA